MLRTTLRRLGAWLPSQCAICHAWPARRVCDACAARFAQPQARCTGCALPLPASGHAPEGMRCGTCLRTPLGLERCVAAVDYAYPWAGIVGHYKFQADPAWASTLARLLHSTPWAEPLMDAADWVLPIPLSAHRLRERGFNQALLLARILTPAKTDATLLLRLHDTQAQSGLGRAQRLRNLQGALAVDPLRASALQGRSVLLVDDVMTTGATLQAAAQALRQAGAGTVSALVFARTPAPE
jgi:ComF family protein